MTHRTQDTGHRTQDTGHRTQDTGHRTQDTGHRTQDTGHTGYRTQDIQDRLPSYMPTPKMATSGHLGGWPV